MGRQLSRREFIVSSAAASAIALLPSPLFAATSSQSRRVEVLFDHEIGQVRPELHGHFAEHLGSCVYGGLWVGKNSPVPNTNGYRTQAIEFLKELGIPMLRWPGGCFADDYHWRDGIGPANKRPKRVNIHWGGYVEDNSFGTHEFIGLCRLIGAEPYLAGNVGSGTPTEMRDWIEYCNMPSGSTLAEERVANGSPEPFRVRYWGVGNESWGCGGWMRPEVYADHYRRFSVYLREFGGTEPFLIASGPNGNDARWSHGFMERLEGGAPNGFAMHYYEGGAAAPTKFTAANMTDQFAIFKKVEDAIQQQRSLLNGYREGKKVALLLDEWGVWDQIPKEDQEKRGALWQQSTMRSAIAAGLGLNMFNRQADKLYACNIAQIANVLQSLLVTDGPEGKDCVRTTTYYAFAMFKAHRSQTAIETQTDEGAPVGLSVSASKRDGRAVISLVNPYPEADLHVECTVRGAVPKSATGKVLHDSDWNAFNGFDVPDRVVPKQLAVHVESGKVAVELPRLSIATVEVAVQ